LLKGAAPRGERPAAVLTTAILAVLDARKIGGRW
jgi:hypothetical protein